MSPEEVLNRTVLDCIAEIDMEDIEEMLAPIRAQLPAPDSVLWRYDVCELEIYTALSAEQKVNPRALIADIKHGAEFSWGSVKTPWSEDEEEKVA